MAEAWYIPYLLLKVPETIHSKWVDNCRKLKQILGFFQTHKGISFFTNEADWGNNNQSNIYPLITAYFYTGARG